MIAFAAITAKYTISDDGSFVEKGPVSNIPYHEEFYKIRAFLKKVGKTDYYKQLILFWNHCVFKGLSTSAAAKDNTGDEDSDINDMTAAMMAVTLSKEPADSVIAVAATTSIDPSQAAPSNNPAAAAGVHLDLSPEKEQEEAPAPSHVDGATYYISNSEALPQRGGRAGKASSGRGRNKATRSGATPAEPRPTRTTRKNNKM